MAIKLAITPDGDEFHVWVMLDDSDINTDPRARDESFVIGSGSTVTIALDQAYAELERISGEIEVLLFDQAARDAIVLQTAGGR